MRVIFTIVIVFISSIGLAHGFFLAPLSAQTDEQQIDLVPSCAGAPFPMPPIIPGGFTGITNTTLVFDYKTNVDYSRPNQLTIVIPQFERISYDSLTRQLVSISALNPPEFKTITGPEQYCLERAIGMSGFFEADRYYPRTVNVTAEFPGDERYYSLGIILGNRTHTVVWTDLSVGVPEGIDRIVEEIESLAAR